METRICKKCGIEKPLDEFPMSRGRREHRCKECRNKHTKEYVKANKEKRAEYQRKYREKNPEINKKCWMKGNEKRSEKLKKQTQIKKLSKILLKFADLKENPLKFKKITEVPVSTLTLEEKKERNKLKQKEWRAKNKDKINASKKKSRLANKDKINAEKRRKYHLGKGVSPEQIEFNEELRKVIRELGY